MNARLSSGLTVPGLSTWSANRDAKNASLSVGFRVFALRSWLNATSALDKLFHAIARDFFFLQSDRDAGALRRSSWDLSQPSEADPSPLAPARRRGSSPPRSPD